jgi:hypothetical protein
MDEEEQFAFDLIGGPHPGMLIVGAVHYPWPPPGIIPEAGGSYVKTTEMRPPTNDPGSRLRGATYKWTPDN